MTTSFRRRIAKGISLRARLVLGITLVFALALSVGTVALVLSIEKTVTRSLETVERIELDELRQRIEKSGPVDELKIGPNGTTLVGVHVARGLDVEGDGPWSSPMGSPPPPSPPSPPAWSVTPVEISGAQRGTVWVARSLSDVRRSAEVLTRFLAVLVPLLVALIGFSAWILVGRTLAPVQHMTRRLATVSDRLAGERLEVPSTKDEIAELAQTMNAMLERLETAAFRQREFVSDASHELRSPVASLRTQLEIGLLYPKESTWPEVARDMLRDVDRLETLIGDLLALARLDEHRTAPMAELDLDDLALLEAQRPRRIRIDITAVEPVRMSGHSGELSRLLRNLLDNAARHARSKVAMSLGSYDGEIVLTVDDDGEGIAPADRARIFERFTRLDAARSRDGGGVGLGLCLVRRVAERHGGTAVAATSPLGGARLEVRFGPGCSHRS